MYGLMRGCLGGVRGHQGVYRARFVSETAQVELKSGRVYAPALNSARVVSGRSCICVPRATRFTWGKGLGAVMLTIRTNVEPYITVPQTAHQAHEVWLTVRQPWRAQPAGNKGCCVVTQSGDLLQRVDVCLHHCPCT